MAISTARKAGYPNWPSGNPEVMGTALYFDPVNFTSRIHAPVLAAIGYIDTTSPPAGVWTAMNQIPGPWEVVSMVGSDHNNRTPQKQRVCRALQGSARRDSQRGRVQAPEPGHALKSNVPVPD